MLGLNDALVELTGMIAGMTFALSGTKIVALTAVITGAAATLSMAASNYLAERAERSSTALKSSFYYRNCLFDYSGSARHAVLDFTGQSVYHGLYHHDYYSYPDYSVFYFLSVSGTVHLFLVSV